MSQPAKELSNSELLRTKIALFSADLDKAAYEFWLHPEFVRAYRDYLFQSHSIVRASVPLMKATLECCRTPKYLSDPVLKLFAEYLERHILEESGHDEWILDDAEVLGIERRSLLERIPKRAALQLVGSQYYWIYHYNPVAMLGYIAVMEGTPPESEFIEDVARRNKLPLEAFSSFLLHARIDPTHRADLDRLLDHLPLSNEQLGVIGLSAVQTIQYLAEVLTDVNNSHVC
jgi:pyrroloquinoline quinone (PQQ) biosynthesis protein C